jgi:hypothetical protein
VIAAATGVRPEPRPVQRMRWGGVVFAALLVTLVRPATWSLGLAGFLARGGIVLLSIPIVVLPTLSGLQNVLGGPVSSLMFGAPSPTLVAVMVAGGVTVLLLFLVGMVAAAWAERSGIEVSMRAAEDEGLVPPWLGPEGRDIVRIALLRILGLVPFATALLLAWPTIYEAAYREFLLPYELQTPLLLRILRLVPVTLIGVAVAWLIGDAAASVAVRRLVLERRSFLAAWLIGYLDLIRRPHRVLGTALVTTGAMVLLVGPALLAAVAGWSRVRTLVIEGRDPVAIGIAVGLFVAVWLGGLVLAGAAAAFRNAAWTFELPRRRQD